MGGSGSTQKVEAHVYDLSLGGAEAVSNLLGSVVGSGVGKIPHTVIVAFDKGYHLGPTKKLGELMPFAPTQVVELGYTSKQMGELEAFIENEWKKSFHSQKYHLLNHNCNHYADGIAKFLLGGYGLPHDVLHPADGALETPLGGLFSNVLDAVTGQGANLNPIREDPSNALKEPPNACPNTSTPPVDIAVHIINGISERSLFAEVGSDWMDGIGATGEASKLSDDTCKWLITPEEGGYSIVNKGSQRRLYAQRNKSWEEEVGASRRTHFEDSIWNFVKADKGGFRIVNQYSQRALYALTAVDGQKGLGAANPGELHEDIWYIQPEATGN